MEWSGLFFSLVEGAFPELAPVQSGRVHIEKIKATLGVGDSIRVAAINSEEEWFEGSRPWFGRIIDIISAFEEDDRRDGRHPDLDEYLQEDREGRYTQYIKVQLYAINDGQDRDSNAAINWPIRSVYTRRACAGLTEAAPTNAYMWILPHNVEDIAYFPHLHEVENQLHGQMSKRNKTFYITQQVLISTEFEGNSEMLPAAFSPLSHKQYQCFPPAYNTHGQTCLETLHVVTKQCAQMLGKMGKLGGRAQVKVPLTTLQWDFLERELADELGCEPARKTGYTKQQITHLNLSQQTESLRTVRSTFKAATTEQLNRLCRVFTSNLGIGRKQKHPSMADRHKPSYRPHRLRNGETVRVVNLQLPSDGTSSWLDNEDAAPALTEDSQPNFISLSFDGRMKELCIRLSCHAVVVGSCRAADFVATLDTAREEWFDTDVERRMVGRSMRLEHDGAKRMFEVSSVDIEATVDDDNDRRVSLVSFYTGKGRKAVRYDGDMTVRDALRKSR